MEERQTLANSRAREDERKALYISLKLQRNSRKDDLELVIITEQRAKQQRNAAHEETSKLHHQLPNEGSLNRSSGTHHHSFYCCASAAELRSTTLMVIDGALSVRAKCLSYTTGHSTASKPYHHVRAH